MVRAVHRRFSPRQRVRQAGAARRTGAAGTRPNESIVAADPNVLPLGTRIRISGLAKRYNRVYTVMDTGANIRGRRIDLFMRDCREAVAFGRRSARVSLLR